VYGNGAWNPGPTTTGKPGPTGATGKPGAATGKPGLMIPVPPVTTGPSFPANDTVANVKKRMRSFMMVMS